MTVTTGTLTAQTVFGWMKHDDGDEYTVQVTAQNRQTR